MGEQHAQFPLTKRDNANPGLPLKSQLIVFSHAKWYQTSQAKSARRGPPEGRECQVYRAYTSIRLVRHILIYNMSEVVGFYVKNL